MDVAIVKGTYHKKGMISQLVEKFVEGIKKVDKKSNITIFDLLDIEVNFCKGCLNCTKNPELSLGKCIFNDDATKILRKLLDSDLIVFATPIYNSGPTALIKKFIERSIPITSGKGIPQPRNKVIRGKVGVIILSTDMPPILNDLTNQTSYSKFIFKKFSKWFGCDKKYVLSAGGMNDGPKLKEYFLKKSYRLGIKVAKKFS